MLARASDVSESFRKRLAAVLRKWDAAAERAANLWSRNQTTRETQAAYDAKADLVLRHAQSIAIETVNGIYSDTVDPEPDQRNEIALVRFQGRFYLVWWNTIQRFEPNEFLDLDACA